MNYIRKLHLLLDKKDKQRLVWLILFSVFISAVETIGIASIMPFVDIVTNFENIHSNQYYQFIFEFFGFQSEINFSIVFGLILVCFYIFRGAANLSYSYSMVHFSENIYAEITKKLFNKYLGMPYLIFATKNSSYLTKAIITEASLASKVVNSVLLMISELLVIIFLYTLLLIVNWKITIVFTCILLIKTLFLSQTVSKKIKLVGKNREGAEKRFYEIINRTFGNFKQFKLLDKTRVEMTQNEFFEAVKNYSIANATSGYLSAFPRLFLETIGFSLIVLLLSFFVYVDQKNVSYILPTVSFFAIALYRFLPSFNRIMSSFNTLLYFHKSIDVIHEELKIEQENLEENALAFNDKIELTNVNFSYQGNTVLNGINLTIHKGEKIGFVGKSGSGKSTLVDLIIGVHIPNEGQIKVDNFILNQSNLLSWRSQIGYIPQQVYLFDGTILENVCFGRNLDKNLLESVLKQANLFDFLQMKQGVNTIVGENGIQLSGGQKQRVAIARALYGQPEILVLDEATSALDEETEQRIINEIYQISKDKTLIIIAHRLSTIEHCDRIFRLKAGELNIK